MLGGSIALATRENHRTTLWSRRDETIEQARALGLQASVKMADAVENAELLVLCVPVGSMAHLLEQAIAAGLPRTCLLTDVTARSPTGEKEAEFEGNVLTHR